MKWYQKTGWIILLLLVFFPAGCYLMWKYKPQWHKWIKWPVSVVFGIWFLAIAASSLLPSQSPGSLVLSGAPDEPLATNESVSLSLEATPADASLDGLTFIYDDSLIDVQKGPQQNELIVTAKDTPGTAAVCVKSADSSAVSNIVVLEIEAPDAAEAASAEIDSQIQAAVDEALAETQALLEQKETELSDTKAALEETQQQLAQAQSELEQTQDELEEARNSRRETFSGTASTDSISESSSSSASSSADSGVANSQTVLVTRTGSKYHTHKCGNGTYYEATLDEAMARGLTPCEKCY